MRAALQQWLEKDGEAFLQAMGIARGATVLDFGCRRGTYAIPAARRVGPSGKVYAVDQREDVLDALARQAADQGLAHLCCLNTRGAVHVPLERASVDVVLLYDVIHLMGWAENDRGTCRRSTAVERRRLLQEMYRVAKPGALLSVYVQHVDTHTDAGSEEQIRREIEECGFRLTAEAHRALMHDDHLVRGHVWNFRRDKRAPSAPQDGE